MNKKNGFTLIELMAVIVILSIVLILVTKNVIGAKKDSEEKAKYIAAKEIVKIAEVYFANNSCATDVTIENIKEYLESDATNPKTGKNDLLTSGKNHKICRSITTELIRSCKLSGIPTRTYNEQSDFSNNGDSGYKFDGYWYGFENCK